MKFFTGAPHETDKNRAALIEGGLWHSHEGTSNGTSKGVNWIVWKPPL